MADLSFNQILSVNYGLVSKSRCTINGVPGILKLYLQGKISVLLNKYNLLIPFLFIVQIKLPRRSETGNAKYFADLCICDVLFVVLVYKPLRGLYEGSTMSTSVYERCYTTFKVFSSVDLRKFKLYFSCFIFYLFVNYK